MYRNQRPLSMRKKVEILLALTFLAWATQTLLSQWGFGQELAGPQADVQALPEARTTFVPATGGLGQPSRYTAPATLEVRADAAVYGPEVKLKQLCRWSEADAAAFTGVADLAVVRFGSAASRSVSLDELKETLSGAGLNLAVIRFAGPVACSVRRADARVNEQAALQQWIDGHTSDTAQVAAETPAAIKETNKPEERTETASTDAECSPFHTLRDRLLQDLSQRLSLPSDALAVTFDPKDQKLLGLSEPNFTFTIEPRRVRDLGSVAWKVTLATPDGSQKAEITANARAWQNQLVTAKPLAIKQVIREDDVIERRVLVDQISTEPVLARNQIVGQQSSRDVRAGTVMTARLVDPVMLAKPGQYITVTYTQGGVQIKTAARAMEAGAFGQSIKVKNEATKDTFDVILNGPQSGTLGTPTNLASLGHD